MHPAKIAGVRHSPKYSTLGCLRGMDLTSNLYASL